MTLQESELGVRIAEDLLRIKAVTFSPDAPFTWASGLLAPIYCDIRLTLGHPDVRKRIADEMVSLLNKADLRPQVIVGTATAGIPHACFIADRMNLPVAYVRADRKAHGQGKQVEGIVPDGQLAVLIEDTISTGQSSFAALRALKDAGLHVAAVASVYTYGFLEAEERLSHIDLQLFTLTNLETLLESGRRSGVLSEYDVSHLKEWQRDPAGWSENRRSRTL